MDYKPLFIVPKLRVKCLKCGYEWATKSQMIVISCPNCRASMKRLKSLIEEGANK